MTAAHNQMDQIAMVLIAVSDHHTTHTSSIVRRCVPHYPLCVWVQVEVSAVSAGSRAPDRMEVDAGRPTYTQIRIALHYRWSSNVPLVCPFCRPQVRRYPVAGRAAGTASTSASLLAPVMPADGCPRPFFAAPSLTNSR